MKEAYPSKYFLAFLALFQIVALPFMYFHTSFTYLYYITLALMLAFVLCAGGEYLKIRQKEHCSEFHSKAFIFSILLIIIQILLYIFLWHSDADDSFYVAETSTILESNRIFAFDPACGDSNFPFQSHYELVGWEVLLAVFCKLFRVNPAAFCHTILPIPLLLIHYNIVYALCKKMSEKNKNVLFFVFNIINIFSGYTVYSRGAFLLFRLWQGKAVLVNIVLPALLLVFWNIYEKKNVEKKDLLFLTFCMYAGFCTSAAGLFLIPLSFAIYVLVFIIYTKKWKQIFYFFIPVVFALPYVAMKYSFVSHALGNTSVVGGGVASAAGKAGTVLSGLKKVVQNLGLPRYFQILKNINGEGCMWVIYIIALVVLFLLAKKEKRFLFAVYPLFCFLTFLNPLLYKFMVGYVTSPDVYWRLFWNLQLSFTFLMAFACVIEKVEKQGFLIKTAVQTWLLLQMVLFCGRPIYTSKNYSVGQNIEKITSSSKNIVDVLCQERDESIRLLLPEPYIYEIRQYTGKIQLVRSRYGIACSFNGDTTSYKDFIKLYNQLYIERNYNYKTITEMKKYNVNYLALYAGDDMLNILERHFPVVYKDENVVVYDVR